MCPTRKDPGSFLQVGGAMQQQRESRPACLPPICLPTRLPAACLPLLQQVRSLQGTLGGDPAAPYALPFTKNNSLFFHKKMFFLRKNNLLPFPAVCTHV